MNLARIKSTSSDLGRQTMSVWITLLLAYNTALVQVANAGPVAGLSLVWPVPTGFTARPGQDYAQFDLGSENRHHAAIDIPAPLGTSVIAAASGTAIVITLDDNEQKTHCLGNVVILDHDGLAATLYAHLQSITIADGQVVVPGQPIGTVGDTLGETATSGPGSCGSINPHLHFELKDNAVLGTITDDAETWGYTPVNQGNPVPADHPDDSRWGFHDPILNLHAGPFSTASGTVEVTALGAGVILRTGPDSIYRDIGISAGAGQRYTLI